jgi:D-alanyl-lipoteichoic acid acyltransferase DltB (MBOAT superfamily)
MTFISLDYLFLYLPAVVGLYLVFRRTVFANVVIVLASYVFYAAAAGWYLVLLIFVSSFDFIIGRSLPRQDHPHHRRLLLIASVVANLGLLAFFKYTSWLIDSVDLGLAAIGVGALIPALTVPLPPGISYYTFRSMSYTIDLYRGEMKPARSFLDYLASVALWPHLLAGPITRARDLLPQIERVRPMITADEARYGLMLIVWGVFKKVVLADNFGYLVDSIEGYYRYASGFSGAGLLFAYACAGYIYCDFSAYTDIARGSAKLVGVELMRNFNTPFFAASVSDFWQRWHISLTRFVISYFFNPIVLRAVRKRQARGLPVSPQAMARPGPFLTVYVWPTLLTMTLIGVWHGAGVGFIAFGLYHGILLVLNRLVPFDRYLTARFGAAGKWLAIVIVFHLVCLGYIPFRARTDAIIPMLWSIPAMFDVARFDLRHFLGFGWGIAVLGVVPAITDYLGYRKGGEFTDLFKTLNPYACAALACACYFALIIFGKRDSGQFVYFQF